MIINTNEMTAFVNGEPATGDILRGQPRAAIPVIVLGEFSYGTGGSRHRKTHEAWLNRNLAAFELLEVTAETTIAYAGLRGALKRLGRPIPANDAWIEIGRAHV